LRAFAFEPSTLFVKLFNSDNLEVQIQPKMHCLLLGFPSKQWLESLIDVKDSGTQAVTIIINYFTFGLRSDFAVDLS